MKCEYCDQVIESNLENCPHCGAVISKVNNVNQTVVNQPVNQPVNNINTTIMDMNVQAAPAKKNNNKTIIIIIIAVILAVIVFGIVAINVFVGVKEKVDDIIKENKIGVDGYNYESEVYYITDNPVTIDNSTGVAYTGYNNGVKTSTTKMNYSTTQSLTSMTTSRSTVQTTKSTTTTIDPNLGNSNTKISRTVMIYMVGSDLESQYKEASYDLSEMGGANIDDYTNVYVYAGGSTKWHVSLISSEDNGIYQIKNGKLYSVTTMGNKNMGEASTLSEYINYVTSISDTDEYDLILWNHGGGPLFGYGKDEKTNDMLSVKEISTALSNTTFNNGKKLEFIGFDACLMASVEVAYYLRDYSRFMIASEEIESGLGWNYDALSNASKLNTVDFAKQIINDFSTDNAEYVSYYPNSVYTLSLIDLSKIDNLVKNLNNGFKGVQGEIQDSYTTLSKARYNTLEFGKSTSTQSYDLVDMYSLIDNYDTSSLDGLLKDIESSVVYARSNLSNSHGLSIYFPYTNSYGMNYLRTYYSTFTEFNDYYEYLYSFLNIKNGESRFAWEIKDEDFSYNRSANQLSITLTDEQVENYLSAFYLIFQKQEDGNYMPVYRGNNFTLNDHELIANYNKKYLAVTDGKDSGTVTLIESKKTNKGTLYKSIAVVMNYENGFDVSSGYVNIFIKDEKVTVQGLNPFGSANETEIDNEGNKVEWQLTDWDSVQFVNYRYNILDEKNRYTSKWKSLDTKYLYEIAPKKDKVEFKLVDLDPEGEYAAVINVVDTQNNMYSSDLIPIQ